MTALELRAARDAIPSSSISMIIERCSFNFRRHQSDIIAVHINGTFPEGILLMKTSKLNPPYQHVISQNALGAVSQSKSPYIRHTSIPFYTPQYLIKHFRFIFKKKPIRITSSCLGLHIFY